MNALKKSLKLAAFASILGSSFAIAGDYDSKSVMESPAEPTGFDPHRVDAHAPIGVMGDHTHEAGEMMVSYRYMTMHMDGHQAGTNGLTSHQVYDFGFAVAAESMDSHMHMLGIMYAPTDWLTLTSMLNYVQKDMQLLSNPHGGGHGHGHGGGANSFGHSSEGLGDITVGALVKVYDANRQRVHLNLGFVLPTAEVDEKMGNSFLPYGMQLGSGTFDFKPGITYLGQADNLSWGAQAMGTFRLEDENDSGFSYGDGVNITTWVAHPLSDMLSVSGRLNYSYYDALEGHYNGPHGHAAPPHFQQNYGGHTLEAGVGLNLLFKNGALSGHRLAVEALTPLYQDLNGVGMDREYSIVIGWQKSF